MKKEEYRKRISDMGLGKRSVTQQTGYSSAPDICGCFQDGKLWIVYENDERGHHEVMLRTESEDEAFQFLFDYIEGMALL